jgi:hypothetical protein
MLNVYIYLTLQYWQGDTREQQLIFQSSNFQHSNACMFCQQSFIRLTSKVPRYGCSLSGQLHKFK